jgi:hypothetical protein
MEADLCTVSPDPQRCPLFPLETHISEAEKSRRKKVIMSRRVKIDKTKEDIALEALQRADAAYG